MAKSYRCFLSVLANTESGCGSIPEIFLVSLPHLNEFFTSLDEFINPTVLVLIKLKYIYRLRTWKTLSVITSESHRKTTSPTTNASLPFRPGITSRVKTYAWYIHSADSIRSIKRY